MALFCGSAPGSAGAGSLSGPITGLGVAAVLEDVLQLPATGSPQRTRINMLREAPDASGRLFVNDLRGPLYVIDGASVVTYFDLSALRAEFIDSPGLAMGFVSFALHPDFATKGLFYTVHTESVGALPPSHGPALPTAISHHSILSEWKASDPSANTWSGTSRELIRVASPHRIHNLGEVAFDPTLGASDPDRGLLYVSAGDFGSVNIGEPEQLQRLDTFFGALLRIDPLGGTDADYSYGVPNSNPYATDGDPDTFGEIYAHGFRNGHRISWSLQGLGGPFVSDIGQANLEELNVLVAGRNYGWPEREGTYALDVESDPTTVFALPPDDASFGYSYPAAQYDHEEGRATAGGFVVEADPSSHLYGKFVFGDIVNGRIFAADTAEIAAADDGDPSTTAQVFALALLHAGSEKTLLEVVRAAVGNPSLQRVDLRFATDAAGTLYVLTKQDGFLRRLVPSTLPSVPALPGALRLGLGFGIAALAGGWLGHLGARPASTSRVSSPHGTEDPTEQTLRRLEGDA